jgi:hypothetical protein
MCEQSVVIYTNDYYQISLLEVLIQQLGIGYRVRQVPVTKPYITVHGVPLDEDRAFAWIEEQRTKLKALEEIENE